MDIKEEEGIKKELIQERRTRKIGLLSWTILTSGSHAMITLRGGRRKEYLLASFIGLYSCVNGGGGFFHGDNAVLPVQEGRNNRFCETRACLGSVLLRAHAIHYTCFMDLDTCLLFLPLLLRPSLSLYLEVEKASSSNRISKKFSPLFSSTKFLPTIL